MNKRLAGTYNSAFYDEKAFKNPKEEGGEVNTTLPNHLANG